MDYARSGHFVYASTLPASRQREPIKKNAQTHTQNRTTFKHSRKWGFDRLCSRTNTDHKLRRSPPVVSPRSARSRLKHQTVVKAHTFIVRACALANEINIDHIARCLRAYEHVCVRVCVWRAFAHFEMKITTRMSARVVQIYTTSSRSRRGRAPFVCVFGRRLRPLESTYGLTGIWFFFCVSVRLLLSALRSVLPPNSRVRIVYTFFFGACRRSASPIV